MKILYLSAYSADSHLRWRDFLFYCFPQWEWHQLTLPARFFTLNLRGSPLIWTDRWREQLSQKYDLIIADSTVDLASLKGIHRNLAEVPSILYFHENQFAYPIRSPLLERERVHLSLVNVYSGLSADKIFFNSRYNRESFLKGLEGLLRKLPIKFSKNLVEELSEKSKVLPVPIEDVWFELNERRGKRKGKKLRIIWNHRWEYDKGPERLLCAIQRLAEKTEDFRLSIAGKKFREIPKEFLILKREFGQLIDHWGYLEFEEYKRLLAEGDIALSTAIHEFQGLSMLEATAAGCYPLVPDRLAYRDFFPEDHRYPSYESESEKEGEALADKLLYLIKNPENLKINSELEYIKNLSWSSLSPIYRREFSLY